MDEVRDDFCIAEDNWQSIQEVRGIKAQLTRTQLWYAADSEPDKAVLVWVEHAIESIELLQQRLIELQLTIISRL